MALQFTADGAHNPSGHGGHKNHKERHLPANPQHGSEANDDGDGLADEHVDTAGDATFHGTDVTGHTGNDVALALLAEET